MSIETHAAIYFYGQRDPRFGFLSNFESCEFRDAHGRTFKSSEQYFMKRKQETFDPDNAALALAILQAKSPPAAKKLGRQVRHFKEEVWTDRRLDCMIEALQLKFSANEDLRNRLLATGDKKLYEAARTDAIWGIGLGVAHVQDMFREHPEMLEAGDIAEEIQGQCFGLNLLGQALMATRAWLREQESPSA